MVEYLSTDNLIALSIHPTGLPGSESNFGSRRVGNSVQGNLRPIYFREAREL